MRKIATNYKNISKDNIIHVFPTIKSRFIDMFIDKSFHYELCGNVVSIINVKDYKKISNINQTYPIYGSGGYMGIRCDKIKGIWTYFKDDETTVNYVMLYLERKYRNLVARRIRLMRKVNLQDFNYFVTFTYNDAIHTEATFKKKLRNVLSLLSSRKGWKYIGVWERSQKKKRLHFHGTFHIPEGSLPGLMTDVNSFSFSERKRQIAKQNDYFNTLFGRNDFRPIENKDNVGEAVAYILTYIEKSGKKIDYSRGLPQYFISDIMDDDIVCPFGLED